MQEYVPFIDAQDESKTKNFHDGAIHLIGFPFDKTASYRRGAMYGPNALREASDNIETYSSYLDDNMERYSIVDLGDLKTDEFESMNDEFNAIVAKADLTKQRLITLGGEHSISREPIKAHFQQYPDMVLLHLDAHADLREEFNGNPNSHACIARRAMDFMQPENLIQYGIRSGTEEEFVWMREHNTRANSLAELVDRLEDISNDRPIYLTFDLDFFDPSEFPGTGTPEAGGETFHSFIKIIKILKKKNFIGADIVELAPTLDPSGISNCLASKVVREVILALKKF